MELPPRSHGDGADARYIGVADGQHFRYILDCASALDREGIPCHAEEVSADICGTPERRRNSWWDHYDDALHPYGLTPVVDRSTPRPTGFPLGFDVNTPTPWHGPPQVSTDGQRYCQSLSRNLGLHSNGRVMTFDVPNLRQQSLSPQSNRCLSGRSKCQNLSCRADSWIPSTPAKPQVSRSDEDAPQVVLQREPISTPAEHRDDELMFPPTERNLFGWDDGGLTLGPYTCTPPGTPTKRTGQSRNGIDISFPIVSQTAESWSNTPPRKAYDTRSTPRGTWEPSEEHATRSSTLFPDAWCHSMTPRKIPDSCLCTPVKHADAMEMSQSSTTTPLPCESRDAPFGSSTLSPVLALQRRAATVSRRTISSDRTLNARPLILRENMSVLHWGCFGLLVALDSVVYLWQSTESIHTMYSASGTRAQVSAVASSTSLDHDTDEVYIAFALSTGAITVYTYAVVENDRYAGSSSESPMLTLQGEKQVRVRRISEVTLVPGENEPVQSISALQIVSHTLYAGGMNGSLLAFDLRYILPPTGPLTAVSTTDGASNPVLPTVPPLRCHHVWRGPESGWRRCNNLPVTLNTRGQHRGQAAPPMNWYRVLQVGEPIFRVEVSRDRDHIAVGTHQRLLIFHDHQLQPHSVVMSAPPNHQEAIVVMTTTAPVRAFKWLSPCSSERDLPHSSQVGAKTRGPHVERRMGSALVFADNSVSGELCVYYLGTKSIVSRWLVGKEVFSVECSSHSMEVVLCVDMEGSGPSLTDYRVNTTHFAFPRSTATSSSGISTEDPPTTLRGRERRVTPSSGRMDGAGQSSPHPALSTARKREGPLLLLELVSSGESHVWSPHFVQRGSSCGAPGAAIYSSLSPDDRVLASAGTEGIVRLWNPFSLPMKCTATSRQSSGIKESCDLPEGWSGLAARLR